MLVAHVVNDAALAAEFDLRLICRSHPRFDAGLARALRREVPTARVRFPDRTAIAESLIGRLPALALLPIKAVLRAFDLLLLPYEILVLRRTFAAERPDLVHINNGGYPGALGARAAAVAARLAGRRVFMTVNNTALPRRPWHLVNAALDACVLRASALFVTASGTAAAALALRGFPAERIERVLNGIGEPAVHRDAASVRRELGVPADAVLFVLTAFFEARKGHVVLVEAARRLGARAGNARFALIGDGPERPRVEAAVRAAGLGDRFLFLGYRADAADILAAADALVLPSLFGEDMPLIVLDAMALGKPVAASAVAGIPEEVDDGRTGLLIPPGDADALAAAVGRLAGDEDLRRTLGAAGRRRYEEHFTAARVAQRYGAIYRRLLATPVASPDRPARKEHAPT